MSKEKIRNPVEGTTSDSIERKVSDFREMRTLIEREKLIDAVANVFKYTSKGKGKVGIDSQQLEYLLLYSPVVVGFYNDGTLGIVGIPKSITTQNSVSGLSSYLYDLNYNNLRYEDLDLIVPRKYLPKKMIVSTQFIKGNTFVIFNNRYSFMSDFTIIDQASHELSEIKTTLYSLEIQSKAVTYFSGSVDDVDLKKTIYAFYNGNPIIAMDDSDPENNENLIGTLESSAIIPTLLDANKNSYFNVYNDTQIKLGIVNSSVTKESGVSNDEVHASDSNAVAIFNAKLKSRKYSFDLLNRYYPNYKILIHSSVSIEDIDENYKNESGELIERD